jgi:hypothetical protein
VTGAQGEYDERSIASPPAALDLPIGKTVLRLPVGGEAGGYVGGAERGRDCTEGETCHPLPI